MSPAELMEAPPELHTVEAPKIDRSVQEVSDETAQKIKKVETPEDFYKSLGLNINTRTGW